jgi:hypothetical protein
MARQKWQGREKAIAERLGLEQTLASGAWGFKGDAQGDGVLVEIKTTGQKGIRIPLNWLIKLEEQAAQEHKLGVLVLDIAPDDSYNPKTYIAVNLDSLQEFSDWLVYDWDGSDE